MKRAGFTLVELVSVVAVLAIITVLAIPSFTQLIDKHRGHRMKSQWLALAAYARRSALDYESDILFCPMINDECVNNLGADWHMFVDYDGNKELDEDDVRLRVYQLPPQSSVYMYPRNRVYFKFQYKTKGDYSGLASSITLCPNGFPNEHAFHLTVNIMGRVAVRQRKGSDGIPERKSRDGWVDIVC